MWKHLRAWRKRTTETPTGSTSELCDKDPGAEPPPYRQEEDSTPPASTTARTAEEDVSPQDGTIQQAVGMHAPAQSLALTEPEAAAASITAAITTVAVASGRASAAAEGVADLITC